MADKGAGGMAIDPVPFTFARAGDRLAGTLYLPPTAPAAAVVTTGPLTSVKEQAVGVYAAALARRGFAALAFDHRTFGASEARPGNWRTRWARSPTSARQCRRCRPTNDSRGWL